MTLGTCFFLFFVMRSLDRDQLCLTDTAVRKDVV